MERRKVRESAVSQKQHPQILLGRGGVDNKLRGGVR